MPQSTHQGDHYFQGSVVFKTVVLPNGCVSNAMIPAGAAIDPEKIAMHQFSLSYSQEGPIADDTYRAHIVSGAEGEVVSLAATFFDSAGDDASVVSVDLQMSTGVSVLVEPIVFDDESTPGEVVFAAIDTSELEQGQILQIVVNSTAGTGPGEFEDLIVTLTLRESPN